MEKIIGIEGKVDANDERQREVNKRVEERLAALEGSRSGGSSASTGVPAGTGAPGGPFGQHYHINPYSANQRVPTCVEMRGWAVFETGEGAIDDEQFAGWFLAFSKSSTAKYFDLDRSRSSFLGRIAIKLVRFYFAEDVVSDIMRSKALSALKEHTGTYPPTQRNHCCVMEPSPMRRQQNIKAGKAKGLICKHIIPDHVKVEWATATIYIKPPGQASKVLVRWTSRNGWEAMDALLRAHSSGELTADFFIRELDEL